MSGASMLREVLVIQDESSIYDVLNIMLAAMHCLGAHRAHSGQEALVMLSRKCFDAILLDLRCFDVPREQMISKIEGIRSSLVGRVLWVTAEVYDPKTVEMIERNCVWHVSRSRFIKQLRYCLGALVGQSPHTASEDSRKISPG